MPHLKYLLIYTTFILFTFCSQVNQEKEKQPVVIEELSNPYNPEPLMEKLRRKTGDNTNKMHFLVFGDSKGFPPFMDVLKRADSLNPDFCITTADLVNVGGGDQGKIDYKKLDSLGGWFMKKYPMWPTVGNHEENGGDDGIDNFSNFYGIKKAMYSFEYGNAKFIALPWPRVKGDTVKYEWLKNELKTAKGKHIFIYRHRPFYTVGSKPYIDVDSAATEVTELFDQYNVTAVFSGHDHIYYRTKRKDTHYIISAGAGAPIYQLKREKDALEGDVYYGKLRDEDLNEDKPQFKFHAADGTMTDVVEAMYYVVSVKIDGDKVSIEMIDEKTGKVWDKADLK